MKFKNPSYTWNMDKMYMMKKTVSILFGSILLSIGINVFLKPYELLDGGIIGLGLILNYLFHVKAGLAIIGLSIPIFLLAFFYNRKYFFNSIHGMLLSSFMIDFLSFLHRLVGFHQNPLINSILGGIFIGSGIGIMLRYETSTGGTDLLAQFISELVHLNVGFVIFIIDFIVICNGAFFLSSENTLLSVITIVVVGIFTSLFTLDKKGGSY